uniref:Uncharacterized protein n=1 Tax=Ralstonia solanacearum TaxID=305 RepID=A0A0S4UHA7_RALSL|nr:protein of unknown function [Ralstonia solanacearum]CUV28495.1 protein of unknown function [Ralstonia solanacearum]
MPFEKNRCRYSISWSTHGKTKLERAPGYLGVTYTDGPMAMLQSLAVSSLPVLACAAGPAVSPQASRQTSGNARRVEEVGTGMVSAASGRMRRTRHFRGIAGGAAWRPVAFVMHVGTRTASTLARLVRQGAAYRNARAPFPSDAFPGMVGQMTGESSRIGCPILCSSIFVLREAEALHGEFFREGFKVCCGESQS